MVTSNKLLWPVPVDLLERVMLALEGFGVSNEQFFAATGLDPSIFEKVNQFLSYTDTLDALASAVALSPRPNLGLLLGQSQTPLALGLLGNAITNAENGLKAFELAERYWRVTSTLVKPKKLTIGDTLHWLLEEPVFLAEALEFIVQEEFSSIYNTAKQVVGRDVALIRVNLAFPANENAQDYTETFGCDVCFDQPDNRMIFDMKQLNVPLKGASKFAAARIEKQLDTFMQVHPRTADLVAAVRRQIVNTHFANEETIAAIFCVTSRTLRKHLEKHGTSFQSLLDDERKSAALARLNEGKTSTSLIAEVLGYSDARAFRRAFNRWTGMTPTEYRKIISS